MRHKHTYTFASLRVGSNCGSETATPDQELGAVVSLGGLLSMDTELIRSSDVAVVGFRYFHVCLNLFLSLFISLSLSFSSTRSFRLSPSR